MLFTVVGFWQSGNGKGLSYLLGADHWKCDHVPMSVRVTKIVVGLLEGGKVWTWEEWE